MMAEDDRRSIEVTYERPNRNLYASLRPIQSA